MPTTRPQSITSLPLSWPLSLPTSAQIEEARACPLDDSFISRRYPESISTDMLAGSYPIATVCDWAILAAVYAARAESDTSALPKGQLAWANAVSQNTAYAFTKQLFVGYLAAPDAIAAPPFASERLSRVAIQYQWHGMGKRVEYSVTIAVADEVAEVSGLVDGMPYSGTLEVDAVQALSGALTGLLPVSRTSQIIVCTDSYPNWNINLAYQNGRLVQLTTSGSNLYRGGGPWWVAIDSQLYVQPSSTLLYAVHHIVDVLGLPVGEPAATACYGLQSDLLDDLYSNKR